MWRRWHRCQGNWPHSYHVRVTVGGKNPRDPESLQQAANICMSNWTILNVVYSLLNHINTNIFSMKKTLNNSKFQPQLVHVRNEGLQWDLEWQTYKRYSLHPMSLTSRCMQRGCSGFSLSPVTDNASKRSKGWWSKTVGSRTITTLQPRLCSVNQSGLSAFHVQSKGWPYILSTWRSVFWSMRTQGR